MRRYTVKTSSFGEMPIAGYITDIMRRIVDFDGWDILTFASDLKEQANKLDENGSGELFILFYSPDMSECYGSLDFDFSDTEDGFSALVDKCAQEYGKTLWYKNSLALRLFGNDEEFGLEELEILF